MNAQQEFDKAYVTSCEILKRVGMTSTGLCLAQDRGRFPRPTVRAGRMLGLWQRDIVEPYIRQFEQKRA